MHFLLFTSAMGTCGLAWEERRLTRFHLPEESEAVLLRRLASKGGKQVPEEEAPEWVRGLVARVRLHLGGQMQDFSDVPLEWSQVSEFQRSVYEQTLAIRPGYKRGYGEIARALALGPGSARAVGVALAANPWPLVVPCHRVVSADDRMTGFSGPGGIRTKTRLLALEGAELLSE
jgi:methylated-DNA-[protein]-cysteine S-methyltransferase